MIEECAEGGEWSATGFNWRAADGLFSLHGAATKQHTKATKKEKKEKCENVPLQTPLGSAVSRGGSMGRLCVSWLHLMTVFTTLVQCRRIHLLIFSCKGPIDT